MKTLSMLLLLGLLFFCVEVNSQDRKVNWITFEQLEDSLKTKPKKVLISFYADWCDYCKKMDKVAYTNSKIKALLDKDYYAVKMNAETLDTITFGGKQFVNHQIGKKRYPTHEIPLLLASRKNRGIFFACDYCIRRKLYCKRSLF